MQTKKMLFHRYLYDALDRLTTCTFATQPNTQRFYQKDRLATEIQGAVQHSIMQHDDQLLAQQQHQTSTVQTRLLATDQQRSVLNVLDTTQPNPRAYTAYGHRPPENGLLSLLGFNGERPDPVTGHYLLGNGYRAFNPVLMRFNSPDSWSPFGEGGLNAYAYCVGDPVNRTDPTGHISWLSLMKKYYPKIVSAINNRKPHSVLSSKSKPLGKNLATNSDNITATLTPTPTKRRNLSTSEKVQKKHTRSRILSAAENNLPWQYSKSGAKFSKNGLTAAAQEKFDIFQNAIKNTGVSPSKAAKVAGDTNPKKIQNPKVNMYQIRLSQNERVMYSIEIDLRTVTIWQVGGHT